MVISIRWHFNTLKSKYQCPQRSRTLVKIWYTHFIRTVSIKIWIRMIQGKDCWTNINKLSCANMLFRWGFIHNLNMNVHSTISYLWTFTQRLTIVTSSIWFSTNALSSSIMRLTSYTNMSWKRWMNFPSKKKTTI